MQQGHDDSLCTWRRHAVSDFPFLPNRSNSTSECLSNAGTDEMCTSSSCPARYRVVTTRLAKMTGARVAAMKYRLTPTNAFPAQLLDIFLAYLSMIYPPPDAPHSAVVAKNLVLAGNSSGATLCLSLVKLLLELQRAGPAGQEIDFHGRKVAAVMPAGVATVSGWFDLCDAMPSWHSNGNDLLGVLQPLCTPTYPSDAIWPTDPPREHPYCAAAMLDHELVSPTAVRDWTGAPPMWFALGSEERGLDGNRVVASQAAKAGVTVTWNEYEGMPHDFPLTANMLPQSPHAFKLWAQACKDFTADQSGPSTTVTWKMPDCQHVAIGSPSDLSPLPFDEVRRRMKEYKATRPVCNGKLSVAKL